MLSGNHPGSGHLSCLPPLWANPQSPPEFGAQRYVLYRSYVLLARRPIEPISHLIRARVPLMEAQRIEEVTYDPLLNLGRS